VEAAGMQQRPVEVLHRAELAQLYQIYAPKLLDYIRRYGASLEDAEDILTDVFVAAMEYTSFSTLTVQQQQAWLWRVARNKAVDLYRRSRRFSLHSDTFADERTDGVSPETLSLKQEEQELLLRLIQELSPEQQKVLALRFGENLRCAQIAERIGKREGSIRSTLSRMMNLLRRNYHTYDGGGSSRGTT
jgi:RNA polymerase sigma-70 factor (ECF subfamily)